MVASVQLGISVWVAISVQVVTFVHIVLFGQVLTSVYVESSVQVVCYPLVVSYAHVVRKIVSSKCSQCGILCPGGVLSNVVSSTLVVLSVQVVTFATFSRCIIFPSDGLYSGGVLAKVVTSFWIVIISRCYPLSRWCPLQFWVRALKHQSPKKP